MPLHTIARVLNRGRGRVRCWLASLTADIVSVHVVNNRVAAAELPVLIKTIHDALTSLAQTPEPVDSPAQRPAVSIRASIKPDYLVCLEDGTKLTMLKRYLATRFGMTPADYRKKWGLPADYPMVTPNYAEKRRVLAKAIGLGKKAVAKVEEAVGITPKPRRGRKPKSA